MSARRRVTFHDAFFERLDELLPAERPGDGTPSRSDFMAFELPPLVDLLAAEFERMTTIVPDVPGVRVLVASGVLVDRMRSTSASSGPMPWKDSSSTSTYASRSSAADALRLRAHRLPADDVAESVAIRRGQEVAQTGLSRKRNTLTTRSEAPRDLGSTY